MYRICMSRLLPAVNATLFSTEATIDFSYFYHFEIENYTGTDKLLAMITVKIRAVSFSTLIKPALNRCETENIPKSSKSVAKYVCCAYIISKIIIEYTYMGFNS